MNITPFKEFAAANGLPTASAAPINDEILVEVVKPWKDALDLIENPLPLPPELITGILHQGAKLVLGGASKSNKTWTLLDMAVSVATGEPWWGFPTVQGRVLYLNLEIAEPFFSRRIKAVADAKQAVVKRGNLSVSNLRGQSCDSGKFLAEMVPKVRAKVFRSSSSIRFTSYSAGAMRTRPGTSRRCSTRLKGSPWNRARQWHSARTSRKGIRRRKSPLTGSAGAAFSPAILTQF